MPSQSDLDQGGTFREWVRTYLGPTVGWLMVQTNNILAIIAAGITSVTVGTTLVTVNVNGTVTIQLPSTLGNPTIPYTLINVPLTIVDIGGFAAAHNITLLPFGTELISGLASLTISTAYGAYTLIPNSVSGGWDFQ